MGAPRAPPSAPALASLTTVAESFDLVIVGGGPAGLAAGVQAARSGLSHAVLERGELAHTIHRYQKGKHVMDEPARLPLHEALALRFRAGTREEVLARWSDDVRSAAVNLLRGPGCEMVRLEGRKGAFEIRLKDGRQLSCGAVVLAIGVQGNLRRFGVPGDDLPHVTYQLDDPAAFTGKRVVVVGVGDAGIENALALAEHDNEVSIVNRAAEIDRAKAQNKALLEAAIRAGRITYYTNTAVDRFAPGTVVLRTEEGELALGVDLVIGRLGGIPPRRFLEEIGIEFPSKDPESVPQVSESYESNVPGVHLVGAVVGYPLIKNCLNQGFEVVEHLLGRTVVPADEALLRERFAALQLGVGEVLERVRGKIPLFGGLTTVQLREFLGDARVHVLRAGEIVYRRNDFDDSFFTILSGAVEALLPESESEAALDRGRRDPRQRGIVLEAGNFFGEGSLLSGRRRSRTVRALRDCALIESPRLSVTRLTKSVPEVKRVLDRTFVQRRIRDVFPAAPAADLARLAEAAVLHAFKPGETLFEEGAEPDGLHLIRRGAVTVSQKRAGREQVVNYVQAGHAVGQLALISPGRRRTATVRANVFTETVCLPTEQIVPFLDSHPELLESIRKDELDRIVSDVENAVHAESGDLVSFLLKIGAGEATDLLLIDESLCIRCNNCESACAETHGGVSRLDREAGPTFGTTHVPTSCRHCENPKCMTDCPPDAIRRDPDGEVYILDNCIGCGNCAANCPYEVIQIAAVGEARAPNPLLRILFGSRPRVRAGDEAPKVAVKCDLCRNLPTRGRGEPRAACVASCPTGAILRVDPRAYADEILRTRSG